MKPRFIQRLNSVLLMILFVLAATGCSTLYEMQPQAGKNNQSSRSTQNSDKIEITLAQWSIASAQVVEEAMKLFNDTNQDNIRLEVLKIPLDRYTETLNMMNSSGRGPDVYELFQEWVTSYIFNNYIADLSSFVDDQFLEAFPEWALEYIKDPAFRGNFYSIASTQITYRLIYNKDLFLSSGLDPGKPPETLDDMKAYARKISEAGKGKRKYGFALPLGEQWLGFVQPMEAVNGYSGVYFYDYKNHRYDLTPYMPWLSALREMYESGGLFPGTETMKNELAWAQFAEGNIGMMYAASWEVSSFFNQFPPKCDWGVSLPPVIDESSNGKGKTVINTSGWNVINAKTKSLDQSVKLWKFLYSEEYIGSLYKNCAAIPVADDILESKLYKPSQENFIGYLPGEKDSVYDRTPLPMEEWLRKNAYEAAFIESLQMEKLLIDENYRLNSLLANANVIGR